MQQGESQNKDALRRTSGGEKHVIESNPKRKNKINPSWTDNWFSDVVKFRKEHFWDCHAERINV